MARSVLVTLVLFLVVSCSDVSEEQKESQIVEADDFSDTVVFVVSGNRVFSFGSLDRDNRDCLTPALLISHLHGSAFPAKFREKYGIRPEDKYRIAGSGSGRRTFRWNVPWDGLCCEFDKRLTIYDGDVSREIPITFLKNERSRFGAGEISYVSFKDGTVTLGNGFVATMDPDTLECGLLDNDIELVITRRESYTEFGQTRWRDAGEERLTMLRFDYSGADYFCPHPRGLNALMESLGAHSLKTTDYPFMYTFD